MLGDHALDPVRRSVHGSGTVAPAPAHAPSPRRTAQDRQHLSAGSSAGQPSPPGRPGTALSDALGRAVPPESGSGFAKGRHGPPGEGSTAAVSLEWRSAAQCRAFCATGGRCRCPGRVAGGLRPLGLWPACDQLREAAGRSDQFLLCPWAGSALRHAHVSRLCADPACRPAAAGSAAAALDPYGAAGTRLRPALQGPAGCRRAAHQLSALCASPPRSL